MKIIVLIGSLLLMTAPSYATGTAVFLDGRSSTQNSETYNGTSYDLSPFAGSLGTNATGDAGNTPVQLFCDDFADTSYYGTGWAVNVTKVNAAGLSNTRYGSANPNSTFPSGTSLYEELAWLFTQSQRVGQTTANQDAIQEAVWNMTDPNNTPKATATATGGNKTYLQWESAAASDYSSNVSGYSTPDYANWMILTQDTAAGKTSGSGNQEFLAYYTAGGVPTLNGTGGNVTTTPEPASFLLLGGGLLLAGGLKRHRMVKARG